MLFASRTSVARKPFEGGCQEEVGEYWGVDCEVADRKIIKKTGIEQS